jgi:hypothetical protein
MMLSSALCTALIGLTAAAPLNVLVFGDSQGDTGPTWRALADSFASHNVSAHVVNKAVGGTLACGWAQDPNAIVKAAKEAFPFAKNGPDFVWYTAGANDLAGDKQYHLCLDIAKSDDDVQACFDAANARMIGCTKTLLENLHTTYPNAKVGQYNYMSTCLDGECLSAAADFLGGSYCTSARYTAGTPKNCILRLLQYWQTIYVDALQAVYPKPLYTGMNVQGAVQAASGVPGSSIGHLNVDGDGAKCAWMTECVHPTYGTPTSDAIRDAFWDIWLGPILGAI